MANRKVIYDALFDTKREVEANYRTEDVTLLLMNLRDAATAFGIIVDTPASLTTLEKYLQKNLGPKIPHPARATLCIHLNSVFTEYTDELKKAGFEE